MNNNMNHNHDDKYGATGSMCCRDSLVAEHTEFKSESGFAAS
jgi:hypothetical protein